MITLQQLRYFRELAKTEHLTKTAEQLHITQTSLSNTIISLERQQGVKLFDRVGRNLRLSEAGTIYLKYVNEALCALDNAQSAMDDYRDNASQSVSVGTFSSSVWANALQGFRSCYQAYNIRQIHCDNAMIRSMLLDQEIDFVIAGTTDFSSAGLEHRIIRTEQLYLCVSPKHPLAGRDGIHLSELKDESFINLPASNGFRGFCDKMFQKAGIPYHTSVECDYTMRGKLVAAGFGIAITTDMTRQQNIMGSDIVYIPIVDDFAWRPIAIFWNPRRYLGRAAVDFRDYISKTASYTPQEKILESTLDQSTK